MDNETIEEAKKAITDWHDEEWKDAKVINTEDENTFILEKHDDEGRQLLIVEKVVAFRTSYVCASEGDLVKGL